jgi:hypothetical protein
MQETEVYNLRQTSHILLEPQILLSDIVTIMKWKYFMHLSVSLNKILLFCTIHILTLISLTVALHFPTPIENL